MDTCLTRHRPAPASCRPVPSIDPRLRGVHPLRISRQPGMPSVNDMDTVVGLTSLVLLLSVLCALVAVWVPKLIASALWLAGTSASLAVILFLLDAPYVAVIELSAGAGLVAVLFVLAVTTVGDKGLRARSRV